MDAGLVVSLLGVLVAIFLFTLNRLMDRPYRDLLRKVYNQLTRGVDHVKELAGKVTLRGSVSAKVIRKDGTIEDLGELKPPQ